MSEVAEAREDIYYTYKDYLQTDEDYRAEIIDGQIYAMTPPSRYHQGIGRNLLVKIAFFLEDKPYKVYAAPFGVRLFPKNDLSDDTYFEPDITVICDVSKLDKRGCNGPPDMIIEILSPSNPQNDMLIKFRKYLQAGVREYWIVDPDAKTIHVCVLKDNQYRVSVYEETQAAPVSVLPGCVIALKDVFAD
ncbi:MAG: Uma2 family endonuclease [Spirochaetaceae bacterium]|jgi:Uma2 family endonuclease|nr:Uma2 family endonuclease [Spirochaetaceae bacterium]